jgi:hypothetical protein
MPEKTRRQEKVWRYGTIFFSVLFLIQLVIALYRILTATLCPEEATALATKCWMDHATTGVITVTAMMTAALAVAFAINWQRRRR